MQPFSDFFVFPQAQVYSAARRELRVVRDDWHEAAKLAELMVLVALVLVASSLLVNLAFDSLTGAALLIPVAVALPVTVFWSMRKHTTYQREAPTFADNCRNFKAVVVAIKLGFAPGYDRYYVALFFRDGTWFRYISQNAESSTLIDMLAKKRLEHAVYPELIFTRTQSQKEALAAWFAAIDDAAVILGRRFPISHLLRQDLDELTPTTK